MAQEKKIARKKESAALAVFKRLMRNKAALFGLIVFILLIVSSIVVPMLTPYSYDQMDIPNKCLGPSKEHWFGTDDLGRDLFTRVLYGGRYSLSVGLIAVLAAVAVGVLLGATTGYFGGAFDNIVMRCLDVIQAMPSILLTIVISTVLGAGFDKTIIALAISRVPQFVRVLRGSVMQTRENQYLEAAEAIGCSTWRRIFRYVLPNSWSPLIVSATMAVANTVLALAQLSYLGLGIAPPTPEWGALLSSARGFMRDYPYMLIFPGIFIFLTVLSLNMFGDGLRDALDPRLKD